MIVQALAALKIDKKFLDLKIGKRFNSLIHT